jgi:single-strand DNA-binding protein
MNGYNRVILMGYLGHQPELQTSTKGRPYAHLSIATHRAQGDQTMTNWFRVTVWGKQAELCQRYLQTGQGVLVEGYLSPYKTEGEAGENQHHLGINAMKVEFLPRPERRSSGLVEPRNMAPRTA